MAWEECKAYQHRGRIPDPLAEDPHASGGGVAVIQREFGISQPAVDSWIGQTRGFREHRLDALATEVVRGEKADPA